ncbi:hypothetical protein AeMF1_003831 [Aphanomyces euteiches]|nr:hypothetical protein AeMF1_003831 [Aphanomyces euteiches]KAH9189500.1 hypothetical protein AeNC1_008528 [Aphanomyces euteiches]
MAEASLGKVLNLSHVVFPPGEEAYRVHVSIAADGNLPLHLWLEGKASKEQWECKVTDLATHAPRDADYVLPFSTVKTYLMRGLRALDRATKVDRNDCSVHLARSTSGQTTMALTMTALDPLKAVYSFTLEEKSVKFVNVLDAKIRDLQEAMATKLDLTTT